MNPTKSLVKPFEYGSAWMRADFHLYICFDKKMDHPLREDQNAHAVNRVYALFGLLCSRHRLNHNLIKTSHI